MTGFDPTPQSKEPAEAQVDAAVRRLIHLLARQMATELRAVPEGPTKEHDHDADPQDKTAG